MAFIEFYTDTAGNDVNAGTTTATAAAVTSTNGDWNNATANTFTPFGGGTPFSAVNVGDWASLYIDGAVLVVYVAQVTVVNGGGASLTFSTTNKYGTAPVASATTRSCKVGGAHQSPWAFVNLGATAVFASTRINIKAGTYPSAATARTMNNTGSATAVLWWRGYNTTPGDLDTNYTLTKPSISFTTALLTISGTKQLMSNLSFTGARTAGTQVSISNDTQFKRCRFENTAANAASSAAANATTAGATFDDCYFKATATSTRVYQVSIAAGFRRCSFEGGGVGLDLTSAPYHIVHCVFLSNGSHGMTITLAGTRLMVIGCTFKGCGGDGIRFLAVPTTAGGLITGCLFDSNTGTAINNAGGTNTQIVLMADNDFFGNGATIAGMGDQPDFNELLEASSPAVSGSDPTISATSFLGASVALPFEARTWTGGYYDVGALQRQVTAGGGSGTTILAGVGRGLVGGV